ncbi:MAG: hypothetical protein KIC46_00815 [Clostridiales bacterium]|nr:hypothetical protein [Clostridiales bacterium]
MRILYVIVKALTFPGTLLHALWEHCLCRRFKCPLEDARYFQANELCGHVEHEFMPTRGKRFLICFLPFLFNLILGLLIVIPASVHVIKLQQYTNIFYLLMLWLGISLLTSLFSLVEDALALWESFYGAGNGANIVVKILLFPIIAILVAGAYLERWGLTLLTSIAAAWFLPELLSPIAGALVSVNNALSGWLAEKAAQAQDATEAVSTTVAS